MKAWLKQKTTWAITAVGVLALGLGIARQLEYHRRIATERQLAQTIQAKQVVEAQLSAEEQRSKQLADALDLKTKEVEQVVARLEEEAQTVERLQGRLTGMEHQINQLQAELVLAMRDREELISRAKVQPRAESVELEKVSVSLPQAGSVEGTILQVNTEWQFVVIDFGWDVLVVGDVLGVYRGDELIAKVQVERVQEQAAAARILSEFQHAAIALNDRVSKL